MSSLPLKTRGGEKKSFFPHCDPKRGRGEDIGTFLRRGGKNGIEVRGEDEGKRLEEDRERERENKRRRNV